MGILPPLLLQKIIDLLSGAGVDRIVYTQELTYLIFLMSMSLVAGFVLGRIGGFTTTYFQSNTIRELHNYAFEKLTKHSYSFFTNQFSGSLVSKAKRFVRGFEAMHDVFTWDFYTTFLSVIGVFIILFIKAPSIAVGFVVWTIIYVVITLFFIRYKIKFDLLEAAADSKVGGSLADALSNIFSIKIFSARDREIIHYKTITSSEFIARNKSWYLGNVSDGVQSLLMVGIHIFILYKMAHGWVEGAVSTGVFVLVETYMLNLFDRLWNLSKAMTRFVKSVTDVKEITDIFDQPIDIADPVHPEPITMNGGCIKFKNISFIYKDGVSVFNNFNLEIKPGERIGLVGHSGAGKSTITKLLLRFADVTAGSITIDGQDIRNVTQDDLRGAISYVPQEAILFHRTIRENIAYGNPGATNEEIETVAKKAHAHEFILQLPHGYDTLVGERGVKLSGGERQRVAIARAMLKNSPILILDEATSSLDSVSESYIQEAFVELMKGRTTLVIAHRLSTIQKMDRIVVLEQGVIIEEGSHAKLLKKKESLYKKLWDMQAGGFLAGNGSEKKEKMEYNDE